MTKHELISKIAKSVELTEKQVHMVLKHFQNEILEEYKANKEVTVLDLGKLKVADRSARTGVNPKDPTQKITIPARKVPKLSASKKLKELVSGGFAKLEDFNY